jgi:hypothetical protein
LKVAEAEGVGPVGGERSVGRRGEEEKILGGGKKKALYAFKF